MHPLDDFLGQVRSVSLGRGSVRLLPPIDLETPEGVMILRAMALSPDESSRAVARDYNAVARAVGFEQARNDLREAWVLGLDQWLEGSSTIVRCRNPERVLHVTYAFDDGPGALEVWGCGGAWGACVWSFAVGETPFRFPLGLIDLRHPIESVLLLLSLSDTAYLEPPTTSPIDTSLTRTDVLRLALASSGFPPEKLIGATGLRLRLLAATPPAPLWIGALGVTYVGVLAAVFVGLSQGRDLRLPFVGLGALGWAVVAFLDPLLRTQNARALRRVPPSTIDEFMEGSVADRSLALDYLLDGVEERPRRWFWVTAILASVILIVPLRIVMVADGTTWSEFERLFTLPHFAALGLGVLWAGTFIRWRQRTYRCRTCGGACDVIDRVEYRARCRGCGRLWVLELP